MPQTPTPISPDVLVKIDHPHLCAAACANGGRLVKTLEDIERGMLTFFVSGIPSNFLDLVMRDEVQISALRMLRELETIMATVAAFKGQRRRW